MRKEARIAVAILIIASATRAFADDKPLGEVSARGLEAIEAAKPSFQKWSDRKPLNYTVSVIDSDDGLFVDFCLKKSTVTFMDGDKSLGRPWERCMGFQVQLDKKTLKVLSASGRRD